MSAVLLETGCGNGGGTDTVQSTTTMAGSARPDFLAADVQVRAEDIDFPQDTYEAKAGEVTIGYVNEGKIFHTLVVEGVEGWDRLEVTEEGDVATGTVTLEPGTYVLYCDVAGHRSAGMEAALEVEG